MTLEEIRTLYPDTVPEDWHQHSNGGGWVHADAYVREDAFVSSDAVVRQGSVSGGRIFGGTISGGRIFGGTIYGGRIYGGLIYGGEIRGGRIHGGEIRGGRIYGGEIRGGQVLGGQIFGGCLVRGTFLLGTLRYGVWQTAPVQIQGSRDCVNEASKTLIQIGCLCQTAERWRTYGENIAQANGYTPAQIEEYRIYLQTIEAVRSLRRKNDE